MFAGAGVGNVPDFGPTTRDLVDNLWVAIISLSTSQRAAMIEKRGSGTSKAQDAELRVRVPRDVLEMIDAWRTAQDDKPTRSEAVRRLLTHHFWPTL